MPSRWGTAAVVRAWKSVRLDVEDREGEGAADDFPARNHVIRATAITWVANAPAAESGGLDAASRFAGHRRGGVTERYYMLPELVDASAILQRRWAAGANQN